MRKPIYLDYAATTPAAPEVAARMSECLTLEGNFANPASRAHLLGWQAEEAVEDSRGHVASLINADPREIIFTSGATESNNLAIKGLAFSRSKASDGKRKHIVTSAIEHKAVLDTCAWLQQQGFEVTYVKPGVDGRVSAAAIEAVIRQDTALVSLMHVNNEVGSVNPINAVGEYCREQGVAFHVDAAQSVGKIPVDVKAIHADLVSISAHKMYGPKGIGALYVRRAPEIEVLAQIHGGGHERGMRSGTLPTHQIVGLGQAAVMAMDKQRADFEYLCHIAQQFWQGIKHLGVSINGAPLDLNPKDFNKGDDLARVPGILNLCFGAVDGEQLLFALQGLAVSTGSACTSASVEPSYVLKAMGLNDEVAHGSLRFSFGRYTELADVDRAIEEVKAAVATIKSVKTANK